jgi:superoxide dismutase, Fe-Mn family
MPLRVLEEIRFWKMQEREHTVVIRTLVPNLEPAYAALLEKWEQVFAQTETAAQQWIEAVLRASAPISPAVHNQIQELLRVSMAQSQQFIHQLYALLAQSAPIQANPVIETVMLHIIRESEYFLGVLQAVQSDQTPC